MDYKKTIYIILAVLMFITILMLIIIHTFNNTPVSGEDQRITTTKYIQSGD